MAEFDLNPEHVVPSLNSPPADLPMSTPPTAPGTTPAYNQQFSFTSDSKQEQITEIIELPLQMIPQSELPGTFDVDDAAFTASQPEQFYNPTPNPYAILLQVDGNSQLTNNLSENASLGGEFAFKMPLQHHQPLPPHLVNQQVFLPSQEPSFSKTSAPQYYQTTYLQNHTLDRNFRNESASSITNQTNSLSMNADTLGIISDLEVRFGEALMHQHRMHLETFKTFETLVNKRYQQQEKMITELYHKYNSLKSRLEMDEPSPSTESVAIVKRPLPSPEGLSLETPTKKSRGEYGAYHAKMKMYFAEHPDFEEDLRQCSTFILAGAIVYGHARSRFWRHEDDIMKTILTKSLFAPSTTQVHTDICGLFVESNQNCAKFGPFKHRSQEYVDALYEAAKPIWVLPTNLYHEVYRAVGDGDDACLACDGNTVSILKEYLTTFLNNESDKTALQQMMLKAKMDLKGGNEAVFVGSVFETWARGMHASKQASGHKPIDLRYLSKWRSSDAGVLSFGKIMLAPNMGSVTAMYSAMRIHSIEIKNKPTMRQ